MKKYFEKLIGDYNQILIKEIGEGKLKKRLLEGLEKIIKNSNKKTKDKFDEPFDYKSIIEQNNSLGVRIFNRLKSQEIKTYSDLARNCYTFYLSERHPWKNEKTYFHYLQHIRNLGNKSADRIVFHLSQINFNFNKEYAQKASKKSKA